MQKRYYIPMIFAFVLLSMLPFLNLKMDGGEAEATKGRPLLLDSPKEPVPAYQFESVMADGSPVKLGDFRGKVVFLNFWATWCPPCLHEMPAMDRLNGKMKGKAFKMLAVNVEESLEKVWAFKQKHGFEFDLVMDTEGIISGNFAARQLPLTYILDGQGNIIKRAIGPREWDSEQVVELLDGLIKKESEPLARN